MLGHRIFISYRRDDSAGYARAVHEALVRRFDAAQVFMDVDDIGAGQRFVEVIRQAVGETQVLLVLIGRRWRGERDGAAARLDDPADFVRLEVAAALAGGVRVIPLLLDGAEMPAEAQLPPDLRALAGRNALTLSNASFAADLARLEAVLREPGGAPPVALATEPRSGLARHAVIVAALILALGAAAFWVWQRGRPVAAESAATAPSAPLAAVAGAWQAQVRYDWPNADYAEHFTFSVDAGELRGSASFLGVPRGVLEGRVEADGVRFVTRTPEQPGGEAVHRYRGRLVGGELRFTMQTEGGASAHVPVEFVARRAR